MSDTGTTEAARRIKLRAERATPTTFTVRVHIDVPAVDVADAYRKVERLMRRWRFPWRW